MRFPILLILIAACVPQVDAQTPMYRCGNQYQDRPCDPTPVTVHGPSTLTPKSSTETWEHRETRQHAEEEKNRARWQYECSRYDQDLRNVHQTQDRGVNMELLNDRARRIEEQRRLAGCG